MEECVLHDEEVRPESIEELRKALRLWSRHAPSL
jgi:hypothetical protein